MASRKWKGEGSPLWAACSPAGVLSPEVSIEGTFGKDPTIMCTLDTTPLLSLASPLHIITHTQQCNPPLSPHLYTSTHNVPTQFSPTTHT